PGHRGTADRQRGGDLADRLVALAEQAQDVTPVRVAEGLERIAGGIGNHRATVTRRLPMYQDRGPKPSRGRGRLPNAMKPGTHCVRTHWIRGFMAFRLGRRVVTLFGSGGSGG